MKLQIDTTNKIIKLQEEVNIGELIQTLEKLFPDTWKELKLEVNKIVWQRDPVMPPTPYPNKKPIIVYSTTKS